MRTRHPRRLVAAAALGFALIGACSSGGGDPEAAPTTTGGGGGTSSSTTSTTLDRSPFCENLRSLETLGGADGSSNAEATAVLAQAEQMLDLLDEIQVNTPADAPVEVDAVIDDLRAIADAIGAAAGDVDAAYASIESDDPDLWARLQNPASHRVAFDFFAARCGTAFA